MSRKTRTNIKKGYTGLESPKIKGATLEDVPLITSIIRRSFADVAERFGLTPKNAPTHPAYMTEGRIKGAMENEINFFILEDGGEAIGAVALEDSGKPSGAFYVERLSVLPKFRGRGAGSHLLHRAVEEARVLKALRVEIGIITEQKELRRWYERRGFRVKGKKSFFHLPFEVTFMEMEV